MFTGKHQVIASASCLWETRIDPQNQFKSAQAADQARGESRLHGHLRVGEGRWHATSLVRPVAGAIGLTLVRRTFRHPEHPLGHYPLKRPFRGPVGPMKPGVCWGRFRVTRPWLTTVNRERSTQGSVGRDFSCPGPCLTSETANGVPRGSVGE